MTNELTRRQAEVARLLLDGLKPKQIAHALGISRNTVKSHLQGVRGGFGFDEPDVTTREALLELEVRRLRDENDRLRRDLD